MSPVSGQDALKILQKKGFRIRKAKGSHIVVQKQDIPPFVVPLHDELKKGTLHHIIAQSKDFKDEFLKMLG